MTEPDESTQADATGGHEGTVDPVDVGIGVAAAAGSVAESTWRVAGVAARTGLGLVGSGWRVASSVPIVGRVPNAIERQLDELAEHGQDRRRDAVRRGEDLVSATVDRALASPVVPDTVERLAVGPMPAVLDRLLPVVLDALTDDPDALTAALGPVLDRLIPQVLAQIAADPAALLALVDAVLDRLLPDVIAKLGDDPDLLLGLVDGLLDRLLPTVIERLANQPELIVGMVDKIIDPVVELAIPVAMARLNDDPEAVQGLVMGQSTTIANEMANSVRGRAVLGDEVVDTIVRRLLRRPPAVPSTPVDPAIEAS